MHSRLRSRHARQAGSTNFKSCLYPYEGSMYSVSSDSSLPSSVPAPASFYLVVIYYCILTDHNRNTTLPEMRRGTTFNFMQIMVTAWNAWDQESAAPLHRKGTRLDRRSAAAVDAQYEGQKSCVMNSLNYQILWGDTRVFEHTSRILIAI